MKQKILFLFFSILVSGVLYAQKETNWWFFGTGNSLNFNETITVDDDNGTPTPGMPKAGTGKITTDEGCFTLSGGNGNLMMYSDGMTIWDKNGDAMPNGSGLLGGSSSTQSGIIVPHPGSPGKYYAMSVAQTNGANGITYSVVDMSLRGGLGDVVKGQKNLSLRSGLLDENIAVVRKENSNNYWIIHRYTSSYPSTTCTFYVWELTPSGFSTPTTYTVVETSISAAHIGYLKFSSDGTRFASPMWQSNGYILSGEFNPTTGQISNLRCRNIGFTNMYSCEFSLSGDHLFVTRASGTTILGLAYISWNNLRNTTTAAVNLNKAVSVVQMNSDGRIYGVGYGFKNLFAIMDPESGANADIRTFSNYLSVNASMGLPTFSASWWKVADIEADPALPACKGTEITFKANISTAGNSNVARIGWSFGDGSAEVFDTDMSQTSFTQKHSYRNPGIYTLTVTPYNAAGDAMTDMVKTQEVTILPCSVPINPHARGYIVK